MKSNIKKQTIVICGAGIAGISVAYYLSKSSSEYNIILIDKLLPMSFTTSKSGENFRDFWPQSCMRDLSIRSIKLMQDLRSEFSEENFKMEFSGYNFISNNHEIFKSNLNNISNSFYTELTEVSVIAENYPYLSKNVKRVVNIKNAGQIDVYAMGSLMLKEVRKKKVDFVQGEIISISNLNSRYRITLRNQRIIEADKIVIAAGPFINQIANMLDLNFPIENTIQRKFIMPDPYKIIPRTMPFSIFEDSQFLEWSSEENEFFKSDKSYNWLLNEFPGGLHIKPEGEGIKLGWAFNHISELPKWDFSSSEMFAQVVLKGATRFIPSLATYLEKMPSPIIEYAGFYTRTRENWPIIGPSENPDVYVIGALSGFGTMTACAAGELCTKYILNESELPNCSIYFHPNRYKNKIILEEIKKCDSDGQL